VRRIGRDGPVRNSNERSNERARDQSANLQRGTKAATAEMVGALQDRVDKIHDKIRHAVQRELHAAGAARSPLAEKAEQRLDAMHADQTIRLREAAGNAAAVTDGAANDLKQTQKALESLMAQFVAESVRARDALTKDAREFKDRRADKSVDQERTADLKNRVEEALSRNLKQQSALEAAQKDAAEARNAPGTELAKQARLERDIAELAQRLDAYKVRADAIRNINDLIEQQRLDLADRVLTSFRDADRGHRAGMTPEQKAEDDRRVNKLKEQGPRASLEQTRQFDVLERRFNEREPIKQAVGKRCHRYAEQGRGERGAGFGGEHQPRKARPLQSGYGRLQEAARQRAGRHCSAGSGAVREGRLHVFCRSRSTHGKQAANAQGCATARR
jgi:hypothetical protein